MSGIFFLACIAHLLFAIPVLNARSIAVVSSGIFAFAVAILLITLCHVTKDKKKKMLWHRILSVVLLLVVGIHLVTYFVDFNQYKNKIQEIRIGEPDLSKVSNGTYIGEYNVGYIDAKVQVKVEDKRITDIQILEHKTERGKKAEKIVDAMVDQQKIHVDAVTGATNSSLVIEKACENALRQE
ncbi:FMN-binding domain-containing protein [Lachnospiraceae bacterium KM106-2]|nr:FMN-binding domain-containing protein [Lachnospiraceae bacterium KM106-2]